MDPTAPSYIAGWLVTVTAAFWLCYRLTRSLIPETRHEPAAWIKAAVRSFPWALLLAPSVGFGYIPVPMPAGLLLAGWIGWSISGGPHVDGPHNAGGPIACIMIIISWCVFGIIALFGLRLSREKK